MSYDGTYPSVTPAFSRFHQVVDLQLTVTPGSLTAPLFVAPNPAFTQLTVLPNYSYIFLSRLHPFQAAPPIFKIILNSHSVFPLAVSVGLMLSADFVRTLFVPLSKLLVKILCSTRFRADPCRTPLYEFFHFSNEPLILHSL